MARDLLDQARAVLRERFGYPDFRKGQTDAIATVLRGSDVLVVLPTGGGKSLCYQVPALLLPRMTIVVSPLISLMHDQVAALERRGIAATYLDSTLGRAELNERVARVARGELKLLYVAPERLTTGDLAARLRTAGVSLLAIDEAHCISEWGHDFRPSYLRLTEARHAIGAPPVVALTATATPEVRKDIMRQLSLRKPRVIVTGFDRPNLTFQVRRTPTDRLKDAALLPLARAASGSGALVVYASTRGSVERLAGLLTRNGIAAAAYHGGRDDTVRARAQKAFMADRVRAIVATNAFGMGVDKPDVRTVIHYAMPGTLEAYYQEAGRGGRDGKPATAILLHAYADRHTHEFFIKSSTPPYDRLSRVYDVLRADQAGLDIRVLAARVGVSAGSNDLVSSLRVLRGAGALADENGSAERVTIRVVATPERIRRELGGDETLELGLLRALWRSHGSAVADGRPVNLAQLPPGIGGAATAIPLLEALEERQMLVWTALGGTVRLSDRSTPLERLIPRASLERHRRHSLEKLRAMERYALGKGCRRAALLRYFGEAPRVKRCGNCDNCNGR